MLYTVRYKIDVLDAIIEVFNNRILEAAVFIIRFLKCVYSQFRNVKKILILGTLGIRSTCMYKFFIYHHFWLKDF